MKKFYDKVVNSEIGIIGRFAIILVVFAALFLFSHFVIYPNILKPDTNIFFQLFMGIICLIFLGVVAFVLWTIISFIASIFYWAVTGDMSDASYFFMNVFYSPATAGCFLIKLIFCSWWRKNEKVS